jgi:CheY-like chemotaxis protein
MTIARGEELPNGALNGAARPRVLIVDDERKNRQLIEVMLGDEHYEIAMASSGEEALALIQARQPDLVLLDVMMPGMDGYQIAARIKGDPATARLPIIMLSALTDRNSMSHGRTAGAEAFLAKPVNGGELRQQVQKLLGEAKRD